jgi:hypothetical protein
MGGEGRGKVGGIGGGAWPPPVRLIITYVVARQQGMVSWRWRDGFAGGCCSDVKRGRPFIASGGTEEVGRKHRKRWRKHAKKCGNAHGSDA